jgi:hypothetical protein
MREDRRPVGSRNAARYCVADDAPNRRATKHALASKHPVIASAEPGSVGCSAIQLTHLPK